MSTFDYLNTFDDLKQATGSWSTPVLVRTYEGKKAQATYQAEANLLGQHGYVPQTQTQDGGHVHVGRLLATGGWSILAGKKGIRSDTTMAVTYVKAAPVKAAVKAARPARTPTHRVPDEGMQAWAAPDPSRPTVGTLNGGIELVVAARSGDWARVEGVNGWTGWVDGRRLVPRSESPHPTPTTVEAPITPATAEAPTVQSRLAELERLRGAGLITDSDAAAQRTRILEDM